MVGQIKNESGSPTPPQATRQQRVEMTGEVQVLGRTNKSDSDSPTPPQASRPEMIIIYTRYIGPQVHTNDDTTIEVGIGRNILLNLKPFREWKPPHAKTYTGNPHTPNTPLKIDGKREKQ